MKAKEGRREGETQGREREGDRDTQRNRETEIFSLHRMRIS